MRHQPPWINRSRARAMRSDATKAEDLLWQLDGFKFRRQVPLENYILDFVCVDARLIIEMDGWQHAESRSDVDRDAFFRSRGFRVLRFWNEEVEQNLDGVVRRIADELRNVGG